MIDKIKRDKEQNWAKAINFIPKENEVIIYDCNEDIKIKIGDGKTLINDLPFIQQEIISINNVETIKDEVLIIKEENK